MEENVVYIIRSNEEDDNIWCFRHGIYSTYEKALDVLKLLLLENAADGYEGISYRIQEYRLDSMYDAIFDRVTEVVNGALKGLRS